MAEKVEFGEFVDAVRSVTAYLWNDEHEDYMHGSKDNRENHVFRDLKTMNAFLETVAAWTFPTC